MKPGALKNCGTAANANPCAHMLCRFAEYPDDMSLQPSESHRFKGQVPVLHITCDAVNHKVEGYTKPAQHSGASSQRITNSSSGTRPWLFKTGDHAPLSCSNAKGSVKCFFLMVQVSVVQMSTQCTGPLPAGVNPLGANPPNHQGTRKLSGKEKEKGRCAREGERRDEKPNGQWMTKHWDVCESRICIATK